MGCLLEVVRWGRVDIPGICCILALSSLAVCNSKIPHFRCHSRRSGILPYFARLFGVQKESVALFTPIWPKRWKEGRYLRKDHIFSTEALIILSVFIDFSAKFIQLCCRNVVLSFQFRRQQCWGRQSLYFWSFRTRSYSASCVGTFHLLRWSSWEFSALTKLDYFKRGECFRCRWALPGWGCLCRCPISAWFACLSPKLRTSPCAHRGTPSSSCWCGWAGTLYLRLLKAQKRNISANPR